MTEKHKVKRKEDLSPYRSLFNEMSNSFVLSEIIYISYGTPGDYRILDVNPAFEEFTGLKKADVTGKTFLELFPGAGKYWFEQFRMVVLTEKPARFEGYYRGTGKYADVIAYIPRKGQLAVMLTDITERKKMEKALKESEEKYRTLTEAAEDNIFVINKEDRVEFVNTYASRQLRTTPEKIVGKPRSALFPPGLAERQKFFLDKVFETGQPVRTENRDHLGGRDVWLSNNLIPLKNEKGDVLAVMGVSRDVTESKKIEEALRVSEERLKLVLEATNDGYWDWNIATGTAYFSPRYYTMLCYEPDEFAPDYENWIKLIHRQDREEIINKLNKHFKNKEDFLTIEYRIKTKSGEWKWIRGRGKVVERDKDGNSVRMVGTNTDITEQKEGERKLRLSEEKFFKAFNTSPDSMSITRLSDGKFLEINRGFIKLHGYTQDEVTNRTSLELDIWAKPSERKKLINILKTSGEVTGMEVNFRKKDGTPVTVLMSANILNLNDEECIFSVVRDITERKKLEAQLLQAHKMEAIGQLAGGIAHDFNNILTGILGYANMLKLEARHDELVYEAALTIEKAGERAAELTKQLLGFSRKVKRRNSRVNLNDIAGEVITLLNRTIEENITIVSNLNTDKAIVLGDAGQLQQAILNLVVNARDAMPDGGELILETEKIYLDEKYCLTHVGLTPGEYVRFSVIDTGTGIPENIQEHIFEPFFTTKEQGKGTGMGLAMVYGIVKDHGGGIRVCSEVNKGTVFHMYLPFNSGRATEKKRRDKLIHGRGTIMLVDDEGVVLDITSRALKGLGYEVVIARDGREALSYYEKFGNNIDLVIIDLVMPGMGAGECIKGLKKLNHSLPVILSTGYGLTGKAREIIDDGYRFIQKPYSIQELSEMIAMAMAHNV